MLFSESFICHFILYTHFLLSNFVSERETKALTAWSPSNPKSPPVDCGRNPSINKVISLPLGNMGRKCGQKGRGWDLKWASPHSAEKCCLCRNLFIHTRGHIHWWSQLVKMRKNNLFPSHLQMSHHNLWSDMQTWTILQKCAKVGKYFLLHETSCKKHPIWIVVCYYWSEHVHHYTFFRFLIWKLKKWLIHWKTKFETLWFFFICPMVLIFIIF